MVHDAQAVLDTLLEVGIDVRFKEDEIPGHTVIHLDVGGDTAVEQPGNLDHVEVGEEVNVLDPRDLSRYLGGDQALQTQLLVHVGVIRMLYAACVGSESV